MPVVDEKLVKKIKEYLTTPWRARWKAARWGRSRARPRRNCWSRFTRPIASRWKISSSANYHRGAR